MSTRASSGQTAGVPALLPSAMKPKLSLSEVELELVLAAAAPLLRA